MEHSSVLAKLQTQVLKDLKGYKDGALLLSMWLCLATGRSSHSLTPEFLANGANFGKLVEHLKTFFNEAHISPHPEVLFPLFKH